MDLDWDNIKTKQLESTSSEDHSYEDEWEYVDEIVEEDEVDNPTINEAIKRIEQAKLYESLLKHDFFAPGSARAEIQSKVTAEIRDFILERLIVLVGIKQAAEVSPTPIAPALPWDDAQVEALTSIANRLVNKKEQSSVGPVRPVIKQFSGNEVTTPVVNKTKTNHYQEAPQPNPKTRRVRKKKAEQPKPEQQKEETPPVSENGITLYKGQVPNKRGTAKKMPTQAEIDMLNNRLVQRNAGSGGSVGDKLLGMAITHAQNINRNISEKD